MSAGQFAPRTSRGHRVSLVCHPHTPCRLTCRVEVQLERGAKDLWLGFALSADLARLRIPPPGPSVRADELWRHTCFEAFVGATGETNYHEFNFAPSGAWATYAFRAYRDRSGNAGELSAPLAVRRGSERLELDALISAECLPMLASQASIRLGLSAVVEDEHGGLSYWALAHAGERPDFHHSDAFTLAIEAPRARRP